MPVADDKRLAAEYAARLVEDGMRVGLGTGTTVAPLLPALAARGLRLRCVATSPATADAARALGLAVEPFDTLGELDIAIDGADLATVPLTVGARNVDWIFELVFVLVVIFTLVQAPTLPWVAQRLGIVEDYRTLDLAVEATPLEELRAELMQVTVGPASKLHGVEVFELRLPEGANVTLVVRGGKDFVPENNTVLRRGDQLLIVSTAEVKTIC